MTVTHCAPLPLQLTPVLSQGMAAQPVRAVGSGLWGREGSSLSKASLQSQLFTVAGNNALGLSLCPFVT